MVDTDDQLEATWRAEIKRRAAEVDAGEVELIPWETLREELFRRVNYTERPSLPSFPPVKPS
jgi:hypothetical protein